MIRILSLAVLMALSSGCVFTPHADFGEPLKLEDQLALPVSAVLEDPKSFDDQYLKLRGVVDSVCAKKGCWIRMAPEGVENPEENLFVKFTCPVGGRLIPMEAEGHPAIVEGTFQITHISEADARHLAEDAGKSAEEIAKIVGEQMQLSVASPAARIVGLTQPPAPEAPTSRPAG